MGPSPHEERMTVDHDDPDAIAEVAAAYALDAVAPHEARQVREHLPMCVKCREVVAEMMDTVGVLAYAAEPREPPAHLRQRLLERSRGESAEPRSLRLVRERE